MSVWKGHHRIAGSLADAPDAAGGVSFEDRPILCKGQKPCRIFRGLPIRIVGAPLHVIDLLAIELEGDPKLDERIDFTLSRKNSVSWRRDVAQMAGADGGESNAARTLHVQRRAGRRGSA